MTARAPRSSDGAGETVVASIIVPCYKEGGNVIPLVEKVFSALDKSKNYNRKNTELIFVDDNSNDGTVEKVKELSNKGYPVRVIVRKTERGLSSAVLEGFNQARGRYLLCMDGDLQHPPESVPSLLDVLYNGGGKEFVIGTRYGKGVGIDKDWPLYRRVISKTARLMARPLTPLSDPMTGFFGITKDAFNRSGGKVNKQGFKICLELYVKSAVRSHGEVPFNFGVRTEGQSKLTGKVIVHYIQQLGQLYSSTAPQYIVLLVVLFFVALVSLYLLLHSALQ